MPRPPEDPTPEHILDAMDASDRECFTTGDIEAEIDDEIEVSRWTIPNRMEKLVDQGAVTRSKHVNPRVITYHLATDP